MARIVLPLCTLVVCVVLAFLAHAVATAPVRFMKLQPRLSVAPLRDVHVTIWVDGDDRNRSLELRLSGEDFDRASAVPLEGEQASRVTEFWWATFIPCGSYRWTATTFDQSGRVVHQAGEHSTVCATTEGQ